MKQRVILGALIIAAGALLSAALLMPSSTVWVEKVLAQIGGGGFGMQLIGGRIQQSVICTCSGGIAIRVGPPKNGDFIFMPGISRLFSCYQIFRPGPWALGSAQGQGQCMQVRGEECEQDEQIPSGAVIQLIGTSCN